MGSKRRRKGATVDAPQAFSRRHAGSRTVLVTALLVLSFVYVAGYLAFVRPGGVTFRSSYTKNGIRYSEISVEHYALLGDRGARLFWPLEQLDRRLRPKAWEGDRGLPLAD